MQNDSKAVFEAKLVLEVLGSSFTRAGADPAAAVSRLAARHGFEPVGVLRAIPSETVYCATKWGARGFTQGLREEAAPPDIGVSAVPPGGIDTALWQHALPRQVMPVDTFL